VAETVVAVTAKRGRFLVAEPLFDPGEQISLGGGRRVGAGRIVLLQRRGGKARVLHEIGRPDRAADVVEALLAENGVDRGFTKAVEGEAESAAAAAAGVGGERRDLTELPTFTVDPASAHDFDDAVSASRTKDGVRLWIHIADVAAHVRPGSALEAEAYRRANSTYVPGTVEPMLPHTLSSAACSLSAGVERLAVTAEMEVSASGEPRSASFYRSRIRSDARMDYDQIDRVFAGREKPPGEVAEPLALAREVAAGTAERRRGGSLDVSSTEPEFEFDAQGNVAAARAVPQTEAHSLIEQLMIATNERVAELLERKSVPAIYRVHEQPDPERVKRLFEQLTALDLPTPALPENLGPTQAGKLAVQASRLVRKEAKRRGHGAEAYTSLVLRSLNQARYSETNLGHAGLGSGAYAHFTSPIRRYPDLVVHRALLSTIGGGEQAPVPRDLGDVAVHCSDREREAAKVERRSDDVCASFLLQRELFERGPDARFEGEVSGVVGAGAFVRFGGQLADVYEGFLPARLIGGRERFELDETETMLVGGRDGGTVRFGDPVTVTVERVDAPRGRVDLAPEGVP
jgi:ribonuclease R